MLALAATHRSSWSACNLIPSAGQVFRSTLGSTNKPFAAPGDYVEIAVDPARCDTTSPGLPACEAVPPAPPPTECSTDHIVTVVFTPPNDGTKRVAFLTAGSCSQMVAKQSACEALVGTGRVACVEGAAANLQLVARDGRPRLSFRFPDTDSLLSAKPSEVNDDRTASGPATIAVTRATDPLPCGLATTPCTGLPGTVACIDELFAPDGTCQPNLNPTFPHFTALPVPNVYSSICFQEEQPCSLDPLVKETRYTVDTFGNLLVPINWQGVLQNDGGIPVPRTMRAIIRSPLPIPTPASVNLGSFTPEGAPLPPIFEPNSDPSEKEAPDRGNVLSLFGTADAAYTILRLARRVGKCACGLKQGSDCVLNSDCPVSSSAPCPPPEQEPRCPTTCVEGRSNGEKCGKNSDCVGGRCGALFADFGPLAKSGAPLVLAREIPGICQLTHKLCGKDAECDGGLEDPCVAYAFEANIPVPLESLTSGSQDVFAFTINERVAARDLNGDADMADSVVTLRDRTTGKEQPLGGQAGCNLQAGPIIGRAVARIQQPPFTFPAVETENGVVAFLESEPQTNPQPATALYGCDENLDGDAQDMILRAFELGPTALVPDVNGRPRAVDPGLVVNDRSFALSSGQLFFRTSETATVPQTTLRVGEHTAGASNYYDPPSLSADGRTVTFASLDDVLPADTNGIQDVYVRDLATNALELVSVNAGNVAGNSQSIRPSMSPNGRWIVFTTFATDIVPGAARAGVVLRDRCISYGANVPGCMATTYDVGQTAAGGQPTGGTGPARATVSGDGRFVTYATDRVDLVADDTNDRPDVFVRDRCVSNGIAVAPCTPTTTRVSIATNSIIQDSLGVDFESAPAIADDGNVVVFATRSGELASPPDLVGNGALHIYARDRRAGTTDLLSRRVPLDSLKPVVSGDGRYVAYESSDTVPGPAAAPGVFRVLVHDRFTHTTEVVSRQVDGLPPDGNSQWASISRDGRYVAYMSRSAGLVPGDINKCGVYQTPGTCPDVFLSDRATGLTRRMNLDLNGLETSADLTCDGGGLVCGFTAVSADGNAVAFSSNATTLLGPGADTNGVSDTFVRYVAPVAAAGHDLSGDLDGDDIVLQHMDTAAPGAVATLCPASRVATANGTTAFLRPERSGVASGCPCEVSSADCPFIPPVAGRPDLNKDGDVEDDVVHLWRGGTSIIENLRCAARDVKLSSGLVAALVDEASQGGSDLNGDGDAVDQVVEAYDLSKPPPTECSGWQTSNRAADTVQICGDRVVFLVPECAQSGPNVIGCSAGGSDLNLDGDAGDRVLHIWDPTTNTPINTGQAAEEFVCSERYVAFRTSEAAQCGGSNCPTGLNGPDDTDTIDDVLQIYDIQNGSPLSPPLNTHRSVTPCRFAACNPRSPYRVLSGAVKFLTQEATQNCAAGLLRCVGGGLDLNEDGDATDLVILVYNLDDASLTVIGSASEDAPLQGGDTDDPKTGDGGGDDGTVYRTTGRCLETLSCTTDADCLLGAPCNGGTCTREHATCVTDADCPPGVPCSTSTGSPIVPASPDTDGDGVPDHLDNCRDMPNGNQADLDADGVGDACDWATCGNGVLDYDEQCDPPATGTCSAGCQPNCLCSPCGSGCLPCANAISEPAVVSIRTKNDAGKLKVKALLALPSFDYKTDPMTVELADADPSPIAQQALGLLRPVGRSGAKWRFKSKGLGVFNVILKRTASGLYQINVAAKRWFLTAAADDVNANTHFTVTIGTRCFSHAVTKPPD